MRVFLLNPPFFPYFGRGARWQGKGRAGTLYYPIWLAYATALIEQDHETKLFDAAAGTWERSDVLHEIHRFKPDIVAMDTSYPSLKNDLEVAEFLKRNYDGTMTTVIVGPPASQYAEQILHHDGVDIVARWEYDYTLKEIAETLSDNGDLDKILGISYKKDGNIIHTSNRPFTTSEELDAIPFVSKVYKKHLHINDYFLGQSLYPEVQIFTGRGCPNQCTFCTWPQTLMGRTYRVRNISNVLEEMEWIEKNLRVKEIFFEDDTFTVNKKRVIEFCKGYNELGLATRWSCNARVDTLDLETMQEMKKANCRLLITGYESGNDEILKNIKKGFNVKQIRQFADNAHKVGLMVHGDFIIGLPGESHESIENTKRLIKEIKPEILQVAVASPFPGTEFYTWCLKQGCLLTDDPNEYLTDQGFQKAIISYPDLSGEDISREVDGILKSYYLSPNYIPSIIRQIVRKNGFEEFRRLVHSFQMFLKYVRRTE